MNIRYAWFRSTDSGLERVSVMYTSIQDANENFVKDSEIWVSYDGGRYWMRPNSEFHEGDA